MKTPSTEFDSSIFFKRNMKINRNLPIVYAISLIVSLAVVYIGNN